MMPPIRLASPVATTLLASVIVLGLGLAPSTSYAAFSNFEQSRYTDPFGNSGPPFSFAYGWDGVPVSPGVFTVVREYFPSESGEFTFDIESHPGSTNHTELRLLEDEIFMSWDHHLVASEATGRGYAGSTLEMSFTVSEQVDVVLDGYMAGPTDAFSMRTDIDFGFFSTFFNRVTLRGSSDFPVDFYETSLTGPAVQYNVSPPGRREILQPGHVQRGAPPTTLSPGTHWMRFQVENEFWRTFSDSPSGDFNGWMRLRIVPEPSTALLLGLGLAGLSRRRARRVPRA